MTAIFYHPAEHLPVRLLLPHRGDAELLQWISYLVPLRYFLVIVRGIVLKGVGLEALWPEVIALIIFGLVIMGAASRRFRKSLD